jgi:xanthine dehydrogenase small subunit
VSPVEFLLNGRAVHVDDPAPQMTVLDFVRAEGLTGAKEGCAEGECGACAVALVEPENGASAFRVINSCLMFLPMAAGREIYTVESLAVDGQLNEAQRAMAQAGGSQCGYCTPGFVVSLFAEQYRPDRLGPCDVRALGGNLCRCTGYRPIRDAALSLGAAPNDAFRQRLDLEAPALLPFSGAGFSRPGSIKDCLAILEHDRGATLVAGATDLGVESNLRGRRWPHLVSLDAIGELRELVDAPERVMIGSALPLSEVARRWVAAPPVMGEWLGLFGSPLIRNRATIGGNLATASPIGDSAPLLLAFDTSVHLASVSERRRVDLASFFTGYRATAVRPGELITSIEVAKPLPQFVRFYKASKRRLDDISTVAAGMSIDFDERGRVRQARFAFGGVAATPVLVTEAERAIVGEPWDEHAVVRVQRVLDRCLTPMSDHRGSKEYRLAVSKGLVEKFWWECSQ